MNFPEGRWQQQNPIAGHTPFFIDVKAGRFSATAGCNRLMGPIKIENTHLITGEKNKPARLASTKMMCRGEKKQQEDKLIWLLTSLPQVLNDEDKITFITEHGRFVFEKITDHSEGKQRFIHVASYTKSCTGVAPMQCLQIREDTQQLWQNYYGHIEDFEPKIGTRYYLRINEFKVKNPPADSSSIRWVLDQIIEQTTISPSENQ